MIASTSALLYVLTGGADVVVGGTLAGVVASAGVKSVGTTVVVDADTPANTPGTVVVDPTMGSAATTAPGSPPAFTTCPSVARMIPATGMARRNSANISS